MLPSGFARRRVRPSSRVSTCLHSALVRPAGHARGPPVRFAASPLGRRHPPLRSRHRQANAQPVRAHRRLARAGQGGHDDDDRITLRPGRSLREKTGRALRLAPAARAGHPSVPRRPQQRSVVSGEGLRDESALVRAPAGRRVATCLCAGSCLCESCTALW